MFGPEANSALNLHIEREKIARQWATNFPAHAALVDQSVIDDFDRLNGVNKSGDLVLRASNPESGEGPQYIVSSYEDRDKTKFAYFKPKEERKHLVNDFNKYDRVIFKKSGSIDNKGLTERLIAEGFISEEEKLSCESYTNGLTSIRVDVVDGVWMAILVVNNKDVYVPFDAFLDAYGDNRRDQGRIAGNKKYEGDEMPVGMVLPTKESGQSMVYSNVAPVTDEIEEEVSVSPYFYKVAQEVCDGFNGCGKDGGRVVLDRTFFDYDTVCKEGWGSVSTEACIKSLQEYGGFLLVQNGSSIDAVLIGVDAVGRNIVIAKDAMGRGYGGEAQEIRVGGGQEVVATVTEEVINDEKSGSVKTREIINGCVVGAENVQKGDICKIVFNENSQDWEIRFLESDKLKARDLCEDNSNMGFENKYECEDRLNGISVVSIDKDGNVLVDNKIYDPEFFLNEYMEHFDMEELNEELEEAERVAKGWKTAGEVSLVVLAGLVITGGVLKIRKDDKAEKERMAREARVDKLNTLPTHMVGYGTSEGRFTATQKRINKYVQAGYEVLVVSPEEKDNFENVKVIYRGDSETILELSSKADSRRNGRGDDKKTVLVVPKPEVFRGGDEELHLKWLSKYGPAVKIPVLIGLTGHSGKRVEVRGEPNDFEKYGAGAPHRLKTKIVEVSEDGTEVREAKLVDSKNLLDGMSHEQIRRVLKNNWGDEELMKMAPPSIVRDMIKKREVREREQAARKASTAAFWEEEYERRSRERHKKD